MVMVLTTDRTVRHGKTAPASQIAIPIVRLDRATSAGRGRTAKPSGKRILMAWTRIITTSTRIRRGAATHGAMSIRPRVMLLQLRNTGSRSRRVGSGSPAFSIPTAHAAMIRTMQSGTPTTRINLPQTPPWTGASRSRSLTR